MMVQLTDIIAPAFRPVHLDIKKCRYSHYWLKGGRGSTKSSFISVEIVLGIMRDSLSNAVCLRKVGLNCADSVYTQLLWAIEVLGVSAFWYAKKSPLELVYRPTGQRIIFRGADNPQKIKSTKFKAGYCKYIWYEEASEFYGMEEIRNINQSLMRGGNGYCVFYSFNPPQSIQNWVNQAVLEERPDSLIHHSTYLDVPEDWLGSQFFTEAEHLRITKPEAYEHEYLGIATGTGGEVFRNITLRTISDEEISNFDRIHRGLDWGYASDPFHYTVNHYDKTRRRLYIFYEIHEVGLSNLKAAELMKAENKDNGIIICDSAEPKSIAELNGYNLRCIGAKKGPDSVDYGIKFLQDLEEIVIDPVRCPATAEEFSTYELEKDREGHFKACYPDKNNHSIDATRYSLVIDKPVKKEAKKIYNFEVEKPKPSPLGKGSVKVVI